VKIGSILLFLCKVQTGFHKFHNLVEGTISGGGKYVVIWVNDAGNVKAECE